jgi:hypothetical protein
MPRRLLLLVAALLVAAFAVAPPPPAHAGRRGDALASARKEFRKQFKNDAKEAARTFATAVKGITKNLGDDADGAEQAATGFGEALAFYAGQLHAAANDAAEGFAGEAVREMGAEGDPSLSGAVAGDGGSYDGFAEDLRKDLAKIRGKTLKTIARFQKAFDRSEGQRNGLRVTLEGWPFSQRLAPDTTGAPDALPAPVRLWGAVAARLTDGRIVVGVFGSADRSLDEEFDVRLARGVSVRPIGDFIRDGGMDVDLAGWWSFVDVINNPFTGDTVEEGNAALHFGVDPDDVSEPRRLEHAGILSIP